MSEQDNDTKKEETKTTITTEKKKVESSDIEKENQALRQKIAVLETKLQETGELKQQLTARIASLEEREIGRVLEAKVKDADKRREKIRLYVAKGLTAADVEDIYRDVPGANTEFITKKARLETQPKEDAQHLDIAKSRMKTKRVRAGSLREGCTNAAHSRTN